MTNGTLTLNGIDDRELMLVLEVKRHHETKLQMSPGMQPIAQPPGKEQRYNNVALTWADHSGLEAVKELAHRLLEKKEG